MQKARRFGHRPTVLQFWRELVRPLLPGRSGPFYVFSLVPIQEALAELDHHFGQLPVRHWLSCKTQPLRPLLQWWRRQGRPIEVVSEFELLAATAEGFSPEHILVNGPAKQRWLARYPLRGLSVNFDSFNEAVALAPLARKLAWTTGVRINTRQEFDPETPEYPTQFGLTPEEVFQTLKVLKRSGLAPEIVHFHLRSNVASAVIYEQALAEVAAVCRTTRIEPRYVDCGGGFPPRRVLTADGLAVDAQFDLAAMAEGIHRGLRLFPSAREIWLENGRWMTARSGVLVVEILDTKKRRGMRHLICDGGRTTNALISTWEAHELLALPVRRGPSVLTTVTGPTCMAFDQLARRPLPRSLRAGDHLLWLEAGAYHLPWETRFSHGLAAVFWHDGKEVRRVRDPEDFSQWWGQWRQ
jgi:diaminopimelate decarboxylase